MLLTGSESPRSRIVNINHV
uniref:Uncharacterized protein n=1 Tax=Anguilla anguilla TaxID=7936 RepID=A0A0E9PYT5_ANGAN